MPRVWTIPASTGYPSLTLSDEPAEAPGPGEVRLRVHAFALNWGDMDLMLNNYSFSFRTFPTRIGIEAAGEIDAVGQGVTEWQIGDHVGTLPYFYLHRGVSGDQDIVDARYLARTPPGLTKPQSAALWMQFLTAYYPFCEITPTGPGQHVLIPAGTSTAGAAAIAIARARGATVITTTRNPANTAALLAQGAHHVLITGENPIAPALQDITQGRGIDIAFDPTGAGLIGDYANALARNARLYFYGTLDTQPPSLPLIQMFQANATFQPYSVFNYVMDDAARARGIAFVTAGIADGTLTPHVDRTFPMEGYRDAFTYLAAPRATHGKVVVETGL